jgi:16S rRNA (uracil1498-N3)-methyltransferase
VTRAPVSDLAAGERLLQGPLGHYLARVRRLRAGDEFVAFDPADGREADAVAVRADHDGIVVRFGPPRAGQVRAPLAITWIQGLAKGDKCDAVVRDATELGATRIVVATTKRSVARFDPERTRDRQARWVRIAREAARQCGRSDPPTVEAPCAWGDALAGAENGAARFCLWEEGGEPLGPALFDALGRGCPLVFACGAEGGLDAAEVAAAREQGFDVTSLGPLVLRTETVAAAVLGAIRVWAPVYGA